MNLSTNTNGVPVIDLTATDLTGPPPAGFTAAIDQLTANALGGRPVPDLPTEPGLYVAKGDSDLAGVTVYLLDFAGFWWALARREVTAQEVRDHAGHRPLEPLRRHSEGDL